MKKFRLSSIGVSAAALLLLAGCDESMYEGSGTGTIMPAVTYDSTIVGARAVGSRAEFNDLTVRDLTLSLTKADGSFSAEFAYGDFPTSQEFTVGKYTLTASYGNPTEEGFEVPAVYGSAELSVSEGKATQVELTAKPSKAMVGLTFADDLLDYMTEVSADVRTAANTIAYPTSETRYVYTQPGRVAVDVTFTKPNGKAGTLEAISFDAEAQHRYNITISLGGDGAGSIDGLTVTYDDAVEEQVVDLDISDEVLTIPAPEITLTGAENGQVLSIIEGSPLGSNPKMKITAKGGIKSALLTTTGAITSAGWPAQIDLAAASASQIESLEAMGLKGATTFRNASKMAMVDFTGVAKHINATPDGAEPNMFSLIITDTNGKTSETSGFGIKVDKLALNLSAIEGVKYTGDGQVEVEMEYNGTAPIQDVVTVKYRTNAGVWSTTTIAGAKVVSRSMQTYRVTINIPENAKTPITLKASAGSAETGEIVIPDGPRVAVVDNDVFATHLWASVTIGGKPVTEGTSFEVSTDGVNFAKATGSPDGTDYHITGGLNPATTYYLRAKVGADLSNKVKITTEAATQLVNGDMETWTFENVSKGAFQKNKWRKDTPAGPWATLNDLTLSKLSKTAVRSGAESTIADTGSHAGAYCAAVRTVGYGGSTTISSSTDYAAGEIYLGSVSDTSPNYGAPFASRPKAVKFWWKLSEFRSGDQALASVELVDAAGNVIAQAQQTFGNNANFTEATLPLTYSRGAAKAAKMRLKFRSSTKQDSELGSADVCSIPAANTTQKFTGTTFYVDDVELVY